MTRGSIVVLALVSALAACSDDGAMPADAAPGAVDAAASIDAPESIDASLADAGDPDSGVFDDGGALCNFLSFGAAAVDIAQVTTLPTMSGGTIAAGLYDGVQVQTTGSITGKYRGTWRFDGDGTMKLVEQLGLSGATPPDPVPKNLTWSAAGTTLSRQQTCGGTSSFTNEYTVRTSGADTFLDVRSGGVMFTFQKRP